MSEYEHFIIDFTTRSKCLFELLTGKDITAKISEDIYKKYDVTLLLTLATPCFLVPYDRLSDNLKKKKEKDEYFERHFDDIYATPWEKCLSEKPFVGSDLFAELQSENIRYGSVEDISTAKTNNFLDASFKELGSIPKSKPQVKSIIATIRNALAHGNIFTTGKPNIKHIVLAKYVKKRTEWDCLIITPSDFKQLLENWHKWLNDVKEEYDRKDNGRDEPK
jgi:hypothetical protein